MLLVAGAHILHYKDETGLHFLIANFVVRKVRRTTQPLAHNIFHLPAIAFNFEDEALWIPKADGRWARTDGGGKEVQEVGEETRRKEESWKLINKIYIGGGKYIIPFGINFGKM